LNHNKLPDDTWAALIASPHLNGLRRLDIDGNEHSEKTRQALIERFGKAVVKYWA
jgi:hypothetical protein